MCNCINWRSNSFNDFHAPIDWNLPVIVTRKHSIHSQQDGDSNFINWWQNLLYTLSLDPQFAPFLFEGVTWQKKSRANPLRSFTDDPSPSTNCRTVQRMVNMLEFMLGQVANYCPIISCNTIVKITTYLLIQSGQPFVCTLGSRPLVLTLLILRTLSSKLMRDLKTFIKGWWRL